MNCPACAAGAQPTGVEKKFIVPSLAGEIRFAYALCGSCGHLFVSNPLSQEDLAKYYRASLMLRKEDVSEIEREVFSGQARFAAPSGKILEIGCDTGQFLDHLKEKRGCETYFSEHSEAALAVLRKKGLHKAFDPASSPAFDCIVIRHTLEHVESPYEFLKDWLGRLSPAGRFFIEVPDWTIVDQSTDRLTFEHLQHFTLASLTTLFDRLGLQLAGFEFAITPGYTTSSNRVIRVLAARNPSLAGGRRQAVLRHLADSDGLKYQGLRRLLEQNKGKKVAFYAASWGSADLLLNGGITPRDVAAIFDVDARKQGKEFHGVRVHPPEAVKTIRPDVIVVNSSYFLEIEAALAGLGYSGRIVRVSDLAAV